MIVLKWDCKRYERGVDWIFLVQEMNAPLASWMLSTVFSSLTSYMYWVSGYRRFEINFHTNLHGPKYSLILRPLIVIILGCLEMWRTKHQVARRSQAR
jgi:hypothetical protein